MGKNNGNPDLVWDNIFKTFNELKSFKSMCVCVFINVVSVHNGFNRIHSSIF